MAAAAEIDAQALRSQYAVLRAELEALMAQPQRDKPRIHHLVDELERVQLRLKAVRGIIGNNPLD